MTTYEEWRVTGTPAYWPHTSEVWSTQTRPGSDPEADARKFIADVTWVSGPHLHKRTVTVTDWEEAEA